jgi:hypothetical protein
MTSKERAGKGLSNRALKPTYPNENDGCLMLEQQAPERR